MLPLIPYPRQVRIGAGRFDLAGHTSIQFANSVRHELAEYLTSRICDSIGIPFKTTSDNSAIALSISDRTRIHSGNESYELTVTPEQIRLAAGDESGLRHGVTTLLQLIERQGETVQVPAVEIEDCPQFEWRGCHLDVSRHFFGVEFIRKFIDLLALHKLNRFHWHLTDDQGWRIESKRFPKLNDVSAFRAADNGGRYGGFYTQEQIRGIVEHAAMRGITVVPEIDLPGHTVALLAAYPELSCAGGPFEVATTWGIFDDVLCPGKEATYAFVETLLEEVAELFPGEYFHIGGDECPTVRFESCPDCRARMQQASLGSVEQLQPYFTGRIAEILRRLGKRLIGWDEIADHGAPSGSIVMAWRGFDRGLSAARSGHDVIVCPTSHCYFDYYQAESGEPKAIGGLLPLEKVYEFSPVPAGTDFGLADRILGGQANIWTEYMPTTEQVEYMTLPRLCAMAERLWSEPETADFGSFKLRLGAHLGGLKQLGYGCRPL